MADCYDQASLEEFASSKDLAMVNAVKKLPASGKTGDVGAMQQTEAGSQQRNHVPVKSGKTHVVSEDFLLLKAGDSSRENGGTQEFLDLSSLSSEKK